MIGDILNTELLTVEQAAAHLGVSKGALAQWRYLGVGPRYLALTPKTIRYRRAQLEEWMDAAERSGTSAVAA